LVVKPFSSYMPQIRVIPTEFTSAAEKVRGDFVVPSGAGPFPGICSFHGLPGSRDHVSGIASRLALAGFLVLTFDFRGFRKSDGIFRLSGEIEDAENAVTHLLQSELSVKDWVGIYGTSYGGAVAICSGARDARISCVCARAPIYDTLGNALAFAHSSTYQEAVDALLKYDPEAVHGLADPDLRKRMFDWMIEDGARFNPMNEISKISPRPLLVVAGDSDQEVDLAGVRRLFELAKEPKELVVVQGADHDLTDPNVYERTADRVVSWFHSQRR
jgi:dipeptidyl aminopeptidase/acylaminoacyl peptidase